MRINKILISLDVQEKIFKKHNVKRDDIEAVFFDDPYYFKDKKGRYVVIGYDYVTVVFEFYDNYAEIITAYKSSRWQKRLYKVKRCFQ